MSPLVNINPFAMYSYSILKLFKNNQILIASYLSPNDLTKLIISVEYIRESITFRTTTSLICASGWEM